jgi:hypothetical protein
VGVHGGVAGQNQVKMEVPNVQVPVPAADRVFNTDNMRCVWCSIEVLARRAGEKRLYGITQQYLGPANESNWAWVFNDRRVAYKSNPVGNKSPQAVYEYLVIPCQYEHRGVAVSITFQPPLVMNAPPRPMVRHMVNVVHYDIKARRVCVIDNSNPKLEVNDWDWGRFHDIWDGGAIVIYGDKDPFPRYRAVWE